MEIEFLGQPFCDTRRLGHLLNGALSTANSFWVLCAWAQLSGLKFLKAGLAGLHERGGQSEAIIGIDGGFATREGQLAKVKNLIADEADREESRRRRSIAQRRARDIFGEPPPMPVAPSVPRATRRATPRVRKVRSPLTQQASQRPTLTWWKRLTMSDVMRKPATSHQRNYVILGRAGRPIDQTTWFRETFFAPIAWQSVTMRTGNIKEIAEIPFEVFVETQNRGQIVLRIEHAPNRIANQNNSPTWLNWSDMIDLIRERDYTGWFLVLERFGTDRYRLRLTRTAPE